MIKADAYSLKGTKLKPVSLPKDFEEKPNDGLLAQAIRVYEHSSHGGLAKTKTRAEVIRTKKKWYKQKGTGGARHGSRSAGIFVGGGVIHGPRPVSRKLSLSKKMKRKSLNIALGMRAKEGKILVIEGFGKIAKTSEAARLVGKLSSGKKALFVLSEQNRFAGKFLKNIKNVSVVQYEKLNAKDVFLGGVLLFDSQIFGKARPTETKKVELKKKPAKAKEKK